MNSVDTSRIPRSDTHDWSVIVSGDNDVDLVQHVIPVNNLDEAAQKANTIAALVMKHDQSDYTQITLRAQRVEITMSTPGNGWWSESQEQLAIAISRFT